MRTDERFGDPIHGREDCPKADRNRGDPHKPTPNKRPKKSACFKFHNDNFLPMKRLNEISSIFSSFGKNDNPPNVCLWVNYQVRSSDLRKQ
jgi:hypothetical protein